MHAIQVRSAEKLEWIEVSTPVAGIGEVLIKVKTAGVNRADLLQREGRYPPPPGASDILGMEVAGEIVDLGLDAKRWKIGDKVCALLEGGGYAEYVAAPESQCLPLPPSLSLVEGAALMECIVTVWANVFETGALKPGETVLAHGGSSGIGTTAIQLAKLFGAKIFVTAGSDEKCEACLKLGADLAINYKKDDFVTVIEQKINKRGVNVVLDMIGGDYVGRNLSVLAPLGRHVSISTQQGRIANIDLRQVMTKRLLVTGSTLRARLRDEKAHLVEKVEAKVWPWVKSGEFKPLIYKTFQIKEALEAHKMMESSRHIGKIILEVAS